MSKNIVPFLKWAGGKRWLIHSKQLEIPVSFGTYIEPFLGGGAMFLKLAPEKAILSDINHDLINAYEAVRNHPADIEIRLRSLQTQHDKDHYYWMRAQQFENPIERAVQFIYLNRTCWNGLYRVNLKGKFNVPIGTKDKVVLDSDDFTATSYLLKNAEICRSDFEVTIDKAGNGDFLFVDPPYTVKHNMNGFVRYNENLFSWEDQKRLMTSLLRAKRRGTYILLTNADHSSIRELFSKLGRYMPVSRHSVLAGKSEKRGSTTEAVFCSWL
jgi:DNA adenine methylase